jgi:hypothetical protein
MTSLVLVQDHTFWLCLLFWQDLQDLSYDRMVLCIPFQYIMDLIVSLRREWLGLGNGDTNYCPIRRDAGMIFSSLYSTIKFSIS